MRWRDRYKDRFRFRPFFALVPHSCGYVNCETWFWLERGSRREIHTPPYYIGWPQKTYLCAEHARTVREAGA